MKTKHLFKGELIDFDFYKRLINEIATQHALNLKDRSLNLVFHGGEPLMVGEKYMYKLAGYATQVFKNLGITHELSIQTNSLLLTDDMMMVLKRFNMNVGISFDGLNSSNSQRTDLNESYYLNLLDKLIALKITPGLIIVASKQNINNIADDIKFFDEKKIPVKINYSEDMNNPGPDSEIEIPSKEIFEKVFKLELDKIIAGNISRESHTTLTLELALASILSGRKILTRSGCGAKFCGAGISMIAVEPDGKMDFCDRYSENFPEVYVQHALDYDFLGLYQLKKVIHYNLIKHKMYLENHCDICIADTICDHGCEAFYYSKYGRYGIDKRLVCDQFIMFMEYTKNNLIPIIKSFVKNNLCLKTIFKLSPKSRLLLHDNNLNVIRRKNEMFFIENDMNKI
jgi:radical SAM protein with 4Fe4S-binding SPASM domain